MQTGVLRALRATAASRWRHQKLRGSGQLEVARRLERDTILRDLGYLRHATPLPNAHIICSGCGTFIHLGWTTVSNYTPIERFPLASLAVALGTPFIDLRPVADRINLHGLPRVARDANVDPLKPAEVSLNTYLDLVEPLGALIVNDPRSHHDT